MQTSEEPILEEDCENRRPMDRLGQMFYLYGTIIKLLKYYVLTPNSGPQGNGQNVVDPTTYSTYELPSSGLMVNFESNHVEKGFEIKHQLNLYSDQGETQIPKPHEINLPKPPKTYIQEKAIQDRIRGSIFGLAIGDALGAPVEFRPYQYMVANPVTDFAEGGTWGLKKGQFTDDTSMALCLAASLISCENFDPYDQLTRYVWWYRHGYMSSTGSCFDIGASTRLAVQEFEQRRDQRGDNNFDWKCGADDAAGNGSLMRLAPVPLFYYKQPKLAVYFSGENSLTTHCDRRAIDACRFYGALIVGALHGLTKAELLAPDFYANHKDWFENQPLTAEVQTIVRGSYKNKSPGPNGIRGPGFVIPSLEAALWAFYTDGDSFHDGVLKAINLGDDTDTTAAIYGQLAGAYYGFDRIPQSWSDNVYAKDFLADISDWLHYTGNQQYLKSSENNKRA